MHVLTNLQFCGMVFLSKYQCRFKEGYNAQYFFLAMLKKWKSAVDKGVFFGALLTDLSKAFDCMNSCKLSYGLTDF